MTKIRVLTLNEVKERIASDNIGNVFISDSGALLEKKNEGFYFYRLQDTKLKNIYGVPSKFIELYEEEEPETPDEPTEDAPHTLSKDDTDWLDPKTNTPTIDNYYWVLVDGSVYLTVAKHSLSMEMDALLFLFNRIDGKSNLLGIKYEGLEVDGFKPVADKDGWISQEILLPREKKEIDIMYNCNSIGRGVFIENIFYVYGPGLELNAIAYPYKWRY